MFKIALIGFGAIGYRYYQAIEKIKLNIKIFIVDKNLNTFEKLHKTENNLVEVNNQITFLPKKVDLLIISTTCNNRVNLLSKLIKYLKFNNLIIEKPLTQSPIELKKLNELLKTKRNSWVNTDRRSLEVYKYIKKNIQSEKKITMTVSGYSWGVCCNGLHFLDLFNYLTNENITDIKEKKKFTWVESKRKNFYELENGNLQIKFKEHDLFLISKEKANRKKTPTKVTIKNGSKTFNIVENPDNIVLIKNSKKKIYRNDFTSIKMIKIIRKILLNNNSNLPRYSNSSKLFMPLIIFLLERWNKFKKKSSKVPIT